MSVLRLDTASLDKAIRLDNGWLAAPARLTRTGVFLYRLGDGSTVRELRLPEEVFKADSLATAALIPVVDEHPRDNHGALDAKNTRGLQVGSVGENVVADGRFVSARIMVTDGATVEKILGGKQELSCGYFCDREPTPGVWTDENGRSHPYDLVQRNIKYNHVALVAMGRAGPEVRVRLDSADAGMLVSETSHTDGEPVDLPHKESPPMEKITIDGVTVELSPQAAQLYARERKATADALEAATVAAKTAKVETDKQTARADAADAQIKSLETKLAEANDPKRISTAVAERVQLETRARGVLGASVNLDSLDAPGVQRAVIAKLAPEIKLDGKSAEYVQAMFDHSITKHEAQNPASAAAAAELAARKAGASEATPPTNDGLSPRERFERSVYNPAPAKA